MASKQQASLMSFFGGSGGSAAKKKPTSRQTKLSLGPKKSEANSVDSKLSKENVVNNTVSVSKSPETETNDPPVSKEEEDKPLADTTMKDESSVTPSKDTSDRDKKRKALDRLESKMRAKKGARARAIVDSDDDSDDDAEEDKSVTNDSDAHDESTEEADEEEEEYKPMEEEEVESEEEEPEVEEEEEEEEEEVEEAEPAPKKKVRSKKKVQVSKKTTDKLKSEKDNPISSKKASVNAVLVANAAKLMTETGGVLNIRTDEQLLKKEGLMWKEGEPVSYAALCHVFESIEATTKRLEIQQHLTELFRVVLLRSPEDLYDLIYLASNSVAPAYDCIELGIGDSILIKAIVEASGSNTAIIKQKYETEGDLGKVAKSAKGKQRTLGFGVKPKPLFAKEVLAVFRQIANTTGSHSQKWKVDKIKGLLVRAQEGSEAKYVIRGLQGKLRIGLAESTVLISLAHAFVLTPPKDIDATLPDSSKIETYPEDARKLCAENVSREVQLECAVNIIKKAYSEVPSYDKLIGAALRVPLSQMHESCTLTPGIPVAPMLAKPTKSVQEVLKRLDGKRFTCEYKYDGERAQVHMNSDGVTKVFSRSLLDTSEKYPEVPLYVKEACSDVTSFVLDTEVVAFNRETKQFVPFQVLSTRKKTEESAESAKVQVIVQAFDLMFLNGTSLLNHTLAQRRDLMQKHFNPVEGKFQFAISLDHKEDGDTTQLEEFLDTAVKNQCEGLMVKTLDENAAYEPSRRSLNWLKLKKDYLEGLGDSIDLVPLGAYYGRGKRTGVFGAYLLACYDKDSEEFQSVCKIGTGFSDEILKSLTEDLSKHIIKGKTSNYTVSDVLECDVWFDAVQVWEIKAADLSKSSTHKGALGKTGDIGRGIGLRFPRFERIRPDKKPDQATSSEQILEMYYAQDSIVNDGAGGNDDDDGI